MSWGCPHCKNTDATTMRQFDLVPIAYRFLSFDSDGDPVFGADTASETLYDGSQSDGYWCDQCDREFTNPIEIKEEAKA